MTKRKNYQRQNFAWQNWYQSHVVVLFKFGPECKMFPLFFIKRYTAYPSPRCFEKSEGKGVVIFQKHPQIKAHIYSFQNFRKILKIF